MSAWTRLLARMEHEGSTRAVALMRIGLAALVWSEYARIYRGYVDHNTTRILLGLAFYPLSALMFVGLWSRVSTFLVGVLLVVSYFALGYHGYKSELLHHHTYAMNTIVLLLALTPCGGSYSVDRWLAVRRAQASQSALPAETGPLWAVPLISLQISVVYLGGCYDKLHWSFLSGARLQQLFSFYFGSHEGVDFPFFVELMAVLAWATVVFELVVPIGLYVPRLQKYLIAAGIVFHAGIYWSMPVSTFSLMMLLCYLSYIPAHQVERFLRTVEGS